MVANDNLISWFRIPATRQVAWTEYEDDDEDEYEDPISRIQVQDVGDTLALYDYRRSVPSRPDCIPTGPASTAPSVKSKRSPMSWSNTNHYLLLAIRYPCAAG
jgi:hypothetical protein